MSGVSDSSRDASTIEVYVRSLSPRDSRRRIEEIVRRLDDLADDGAITGYQVFPTGAEIPATPADAVTDVGEYLLGRVAVFQEWARLTGRSVDHLFDRRSTRSLFTGEEHDAVCLPRVILAEYRGRDLCFVAPCVEDGHCVTVHERLEALEAGANVEEADRLPQAKGTFPLAASQPEERVEAVDLPTDEPQAEDVRPEPDADWSAPEAGQ